MKLTKQQILENQPIRKERRLAWLVIGILLAVVLTGLYINYRLAHAQEPKLAAISQFEKERQEKYAAEQIIGWHYKEISKLTKLIK